MRAGDKIGENFLLEKIRLYTCTTCPLQGFVLVGEYIHVIKLGAHYCKEYTV